MKSPLQINATMAGALVCATAWFAFWLNLFKPAPPPPGAQGEQAARIHLTSGGEVVRSIQAPRIFAKPAREGFSQGFFEDRIDLRPALEAPAPKEQFLQRQAFGTTDLNRTHLLEKVTITKEEYPLPVPGVSIQTDSPPSRPIDFFFDAALQPRVPNSFSIDLPSGTPSQVIRIYLKILPDGTVAHAFFETPAEDALLPIIRKWKFIPASSSSEGWVEIRINSEIGGSE